MADEILLISSSMALLIINCTAFILGFFFRYRHKTLKKLTGNPSINVFNKMFNVFDPYPDRTKLINSSLTILPLFALATTGLILLIFVKIISAGLLLSLIIMIISVNLLVVDGVFEIYRSTRIFTVALQNGTGLGEGDFRVLQILKRALPRISNYYFGLAIAFAVINLTLPYTIPNLSLIFLQSMNLMFGSSTVIGFFHPFTLPFIWVLTVTIITILIRRVKGKFERNIFASKT